MVNTMLEKKKHNRGILGKVSGEQYITVLWNKICKLWVQHKTLLPKKQWEKYVIPEQHELWVTVEKEFPSTKLPSS